jgi:hypothetical protein
VLLVYLVTVFVSVSRTSKPDFTPADATDMLNRLGHAFASSSVEGVLSFAAPDAKVAGRNLEEIRKLLHRAYGALRDPRVEFRHVEFERQNGETVVLHFDATVVDRAPGGFGGGDAVYSQRMGFTVKRIEVPRLGGLMKTYDWKITNVDAPNLPDASGP